MRTLSNTISHGFSPVSVLKLVVSFTPGVSLSNTKQEMPPREPLLRSVAAIRMTKSASSAPVMKRLTPLMT